MQNQWDVIATLFEQAVELSASDRDDFLVHHCLDTRVRREVDRMLRAHERATGFLRESAAEASAELIGNEIPFEEVPESIGPYRLVREIARGGMGVVFLAERRDGEFDQQVAVKVLQGGSHASEVRQRFIAERQILASLEHENIARIYDGGLLDDGRPYFVMEFVDGLPIDGFCDTYGCSLRRRLEVLAGVADAVRFAHHNFVVHRDLKPSNILIKNDGTVKLLDFGVAKVLAGEGASDLSLTQTGTRWMTPEYAAPEQVLGRPATTATDVYQLGVVAYKLLTGVSPFGTEGRSMFEIERRIVEDEADLPSAAALSEKAPLAADQRRRRSKALRGDLDAILLKSLRKDPAGRYASAGEFADDIRRYLASKPVRARKGNTLYRARKYISRNRFGVAAAVAAILAVSSYVVTLTVQQNRIEREVVKARRVTDVLTSIFQQADPYDPDNRDRVEAAITVLEPAVASVLDGLSEEPEVQAELLFKLGDIYRLLGEFPRAKDLLARAISLREELSGSRSLELAPMLAEYSRVVSGDSSIWALERAVDLWQSAGGSSDRHAQARAEVRLASLLSSSDPRRAQLAERGLDALKRMHGERSMEVARIMNSHPGPFAEKQGMLALREEIASIYIENLGEDTRETAEALANLSLAYDDDGQDAKALEMMQRAYDVSMRVEGMYHPNVSVIAINLGALLHEAGDFEAADTMFTAALEIRQRMSAAGSGHEAFAKYWLGKNAMALGNYTRAESFLRDSEAIYAERLTGRPEGAILYVWSLLGRCLRMQDRFAESEKVTLRLYQAVADESRLAGLRRTATRDLVSLYEAWGRESDAETYRTMAGPIVATDSG